MLDTRMPRGDGVVLFDHPVSPCARRVRITLLEKGISWERRIVDLSKMEQKRPEYLALNPNGVVPTLLHRGRAIYESNIITAYLDEAFPQAQLYPSDPEELAAVKRWQQFELDFARDYRPLMYQRLLGVMVRASTTLDEALKRVRAQNNDSEHLAWECKVWQLDVADGAEQERLSKKLYAQLDVLDEALRGEEYLVGGRFTQADLSVFPRVRMFPYVQLPIEPSRYPHLCAWMERLGRRPSFRKSQSMMETVVQRLSAAGVMPRLAALLVKTTDELTSLESLELAAFRVLLRRDPTEVEVGVGKRRAGLRRRFGSRPLEAR